MQDTRVLLTQNSMTLQHGHSLTCGCTEHDWAVLSTHARHEWSDGAVSDRLRVDLQVDLLLGDPTKARTKLGWNPQKTSLQQLVNEMVDADVDMATNPRAYLKY